MNERPRLLLLIPHLGGGGAEKVIALLAEELSATKYEIHLGIATGQGNSTESLPSRVAVHVLGAPRVRAAGFRLLRLVWKLRPDVILSGMYHLNFLVLLLRPFFPRPTSVLVRQNATVSAALWFDRRPATTRLLYRALYRRADKVICQTVDMAEDLGRELGVERSRLAVVPNPVDMDALRGTMEQSPNRWTGPGPHLLAVGRLSREKGFDLLLEALDSVRESFPATDLTIAGSGEEEVALKAKCNGLGLGSAVRFAGYVDHPATWFPGASAFVLPSRHEGMPNALLEAACGGLPLVALPASGGVQKLLRGQPGAWLASEVSSEALAASLLEAVKALRPGARFAHPFIENYRMDRAIHAYEDLIDGVLPGHRKRRGKQGSNP